jgi:hypothetical protein
LLERTGEEADAVDVKMAAGVVDRLPRPQLRDDFQSLVQELGARAVVARFSEGAELPGVVGADAGAEHQAAVRQVVEADWLARELPRAAAWERRDEGADAEAVGSPNGPKGGRKIPCFTRAGRASGASRARAP